MKIHVFPFSPRRGTPAAELPGQVSPEVRKERCRKLAQVERELAEKYYRSLEGDSLEVLIEQPCEDRPGFVRGTDRRYVPVELRGTKAETGSLVIARATAANRHFLEAERLGNPDVAI